MQSPKYYLVGASHIDLAWKKGEREMAEMLDILVIRLLDALDHDPEFTYILEQAAHYRKLAERRPDLIERLKPYIQVGRLEFVGGMASTLETNIPNGECFVRNQMLGQAWLRQCFGREAETGWLIDTFGVHAQTPQILNQFGIRHLLANRFGNAMNCDVFVARGLDGSQVLVAGRDVYSPYVRPEHVFFEFCSGWQVIEHLIAAAAAHPGDGPCLVTPYIENEHLLSLHHLDLARQQNQQTPGAWKLALPRDFFAALEACGKSWPVFDSDLNPEFTGTFAQRIAIRQQNRVAEHLLLEAEKWATLCRLDNWRSEVEECWWTMAFNHFHDVFTGSHPTHIFQGVLDNFRRVGAVANRVLERALTVQPVTAQPGAAGQTSIRVVNGLPWDRSDMVRIPLPDGHPGVRQVHTAQGDAPFEVVEGELRFRAEIPAAAVQTYILTLGASNSPATFLAAEAVIENEFIRLECDALAGIRRLVWKATGKSLLENVGDFLVIQQDNGSFQIEAPIGGEVPALAGDVQVYACEPSALGQRLRMKGTFPRTFRGGKDVYLAWQADFFLMHGSPRLYLTLHLDWKGEASRIRLKLPTSIDSSQGIYEIPFGVVRRKPYGVRGNARGEWPAGRFVALEDGQHGLGLVNTGTPGVEISGGVIWTTLLRAPHSEYAGMLPDDSSSQHGAHTFHFALTPYQGSWENSGVVQAAQALNNPLWVSALQGASPGAMDGLSWLRLEPPSLVLSAVKAPEDGSSEMVVRFYETTGKVCTVDLFVRDAVQAWRSDLRESRQQELDCVDGNLQFTVQPFEIVTLRIGRDDR